MPETYEAWRERMEREGIPDPPVIFAGNWARKYIEELEAERDRAVDLLEKAQKALLRVDTAPYTEGLIAEFLASRASRKEERS